jgi:hypothetical protein
MLCFALVGAVAVAVAMVISREPGVMFDDDDDTRYWRGLADLMQ